MVGTDRWEALCARERGRDSADDTGARQRTKYLFFWGHRQRTDGRLDRSCLSQWWPAPFRVGEHEYATAEHWMMAEKARLFGDLASERAALAAPTPAQAKIAGRLVQEFEEQTWDRERFRIVVAGSVHKFSSHPDLLAFLLGTGDRILVEASPLDRVWGIGLTADDPRAQEPEEWRGPNLLGFALMAAREALRSSH